MRLWGLLSDFLDWMGGEDQEPEGEDPDEDLEDKQQEAFSRLVEDNLPPQGTVDTAFDAHRRRHQPTGILKRRRLNRVLLPR